MTENNAESKIDNAMLGPIFNKRLYQQVAERIRRQIETGTLTAGDRLPAEKDLAQQLGVSRPIVREALVALEIAGFVEIRTGSGTYICHRGKLLPPMLDAGPGPFELLHARLLIEGEVASEAAMRATDEDLAVVESTIHEMEAMVRAGVHSRAADQKFHVVIANVSGNSVLAELVSNLWQGMFSPMFYKMSELTGLIENQELALAEHKSIFAALATHDPVGARAAMRRHLKSVETVLARSNVDRASNDIAKK
ncbi:MAG TPA: FadR/GntR family transcriptional regulator [Pseudacidobacterium sp.]|nr:FadR/GntR family transcriptional regulator [Pseudacidobacterium sp.]